jgi:hypothetical protein
VGAADSDSAERRSTSDKQFCNAGQQCYSFSSDLACVLSTLYLYEHQFRYEHVYVVTMVHARTTDPCEIVNTCTVNNLYICYSWL